MAEIVIKELTKSGLILRRSTIEGNIDESLSILLRILRPEVIVFSKVVETKYNGADS